MLKQKIHFGAKIYSLNFEQKTFMRGLWKSNKNKNIENVGKT